MSGYNRIRGCSTHRGSRHWLSLLALIALVLFPSLIIADVIYLKNGRKIVAQSTKEDGKQVYYEVQGGEFALPKSMVDHIEKSAVATFATRQTRDLPLPPPSDIPVEEGSRIIHDDAVDEVYLARLLDEASRTHSPDTLHKLKLAYQQAAVFLTRKGDPEAAILKYRDALRAFPHDQALTLALGYLLTKQEHFQEAIDLLRPESEKNPRASDFHMLLGSDYYGMENLDEAIAEWNKALALEESPRLREAVAKAKRERDISGSYSELRSEHFLLRYEGQESDKLNSEILSSLEGSFQNLVLDFDYSPSETIIVILYPSQAFRDITRSPSWVGALNDGKIRIPVSGLSVMTPDLARILKHELTHSFIRQITLGRCPTWFNEGAAQLEEGATTAAQGSQLARAMAAGRIASFHALEGAFVGLPPEQVGLAYFKSLAALEYLRDTFGMGEIRRMLKQMPSAPEFDSLLQDELRFDYAAFEGEVTSYIEKKYGS